MERTSQHDALEIFLGTWTARGTFFGGTDQSGNVPKANGEAWLSTHNAYWHTGKYFVIQDERADIAGSRFDTLSIIGVDEEGKHFARSFENHGFIREYALEHDADTWTFTGEFERATYTLRGAGSTQIASWEWNVDGKWLPLCDRVATKVQ